MSLWQDYTKRIGLAFKGHSLTLVEKTLFSALAMMMVVCMLDYVAQESRNPKEWQMAKLKAEKELMAQRDNQPNKILQ